VADFGSVVAGPPSSTILGPPDGHADLLVVANGQPQPAFVGPPEVRFFPGLINAQGKFNGFGAPLRLASPTGPLHITARDVNGDGAVDAVVLDRDDVQVIFGKRPVIPPNDTPQTARNLGTVVHLVEPTLTIVPGHSDAYYTLRTPTEAARGAGDEILDFSGLF